MIAIAFNINFEINSRTAKLPLRKEITTKTTKKR
jgi:hypothetical protein